ncbi:hypothetical protein KC345_g7998 [Hortaea werneckii]|nr:hypothetical protein KC345_g7998 [Hortaea werneckii]
MAAAISIPDFLSDDFDFNHWLNERRRKVIKAISACTKATYDVDDMLDTSLQAKFPDADASKARENQMEYTQSIAASDSIDKDDKIAILKTALDESEGFADTMSLSFLEVHITLQKLAHMEFALLTIQRHLDQLKGRMDTEEVANTHCRSLQQAKLRVGMPGHKYTFQGSDDDQLRAAYEFFVVLAAGKLNYGLSQG